MERFFKLKENNTNVRTEIVAGLTTFFTMAYIIFVNPQMLADAGMDPTKVMVATCIAAAIGTILMGLLSNYPFAQASGMGLNAFFAYTICGLMGFTYQQALAAVFISGIIFIIITVTGLRTAIVNAIPAVLKKAIAAGIGLFIALIGFNNAGIAVTGNGTITALGDLSAPTTLLAIFGLILMVILVVRKVKGALFIGILGTSVVGILLQEVFKIADFGVSMPSGFSFSFSTHFLEMDFGGLLNVGSGSVGTVIVSLLTVLISLVFVDMFDTIGTLIGTAEKAGMLDKDGNLPRANRALLADAIATTAGAVVGTSTVTTYVESSAGVAEGGRTGLTSLVTGICFILAIFFSPVLGLIPGAATAPALIIVGAMMMGSLKDIDWKDISVALPAFMTMIMMPFGYSIADGIGLGFITYCIVSIVTGKGKKVSPILCGISVIFIIRYILMYAGHLL